MAEYINSLQHPLKEVVLVLRKTILETDSQIAEQIEWNALAYYYTGEMKPFNPKEYKRDIIVFNLKKKEYMHSYSTGASINDTTGLLEGDFPDGRKVVKFSILSEVENREKDLQKVIRGWLVLVDKIDSL